MLGLPSRQNLGFKVISTIGTDQQRRRRVWFDGRRGRLAGSCRGALSRGTSGVAPGNPDLGDPLDALGALSCVYCPVDKHTTLRTEKEECEEAERNKQGEPLLGGLNLGRPPAIQTWVTRSQESELCVRSFKQTAELAN